MVDSLYSQSIWTKTSPPRFFQPLKQDLNTDICIIGGGIAGLSTAYSLARAGRNVVVVTAGPIGGGETALTSAHLSWALDDRFYHLETIFGTEGARLAGESHIAAVEQIEAIVREEKIDCDFKWVNGFLISEDEDTKKILQKEYDAINRIGFSGISMLESCPLSSWNSALVLQFERQAQFHPLKYLAGLTDALVKLGCSFYTETHVKSVTDSDGDQTCRAVTDNSNTITCSDIVVCTNTPFNDRVTMHTKQAPYRTYIVELAIPRDTIPTALYWDALDPYHYVRIVSIENEQYDILLVGGEDHKTGQVDDTENHFEILETWARSHFPMAKGKVGEWSGQVLEPADSLAFLGRNPGDEHVYIATGDSGHGLTHGTLAGILITDLILGKENPWQTLYDPARRPWGAVGEFLKENLNVAKQYADWAKGSDVDSTDEIIPGSGVVMRRGAKYVAVYKDNSGQLHELSAVCPHLYCLVSWNDSEKSWDCPCHGSRFDAYGGLLNGPATQGHGEVEE